MNVKIIVENILKCITGSVNITLWAFVFKFPNAGTFMFPKISKHRRIKAVD